MRSVRDRDFIETIEGFMFCVVGYLHPPGMYTAYLKYIPETELSESIWSRGTLKYRRVLKRYHVLNVKETFKFLREKYPQYIHYCRVRGIEFSMVPKDYVKKYYFPELRLREIMERGPRDRLEERALELAKLMSREAGVELGKIGVTGSILLGIHNPEISDIDITVYGLEEALRLREALKHGIKGINSQSKEYILEWCRRRAREFNLPEGVLRTIAERRWNYGVYKGKMFSVHPIRSDLDIREKYGDKIYHGMGLVEGEATVSSSQESIFLPAVYRIEDVVIRRGVLVDDIREIVSYEGLFCDLADSGDKVVFKGKLERVTEVNTNKTYYRVVLGTTEYGAGYIIKKENL